MRFMCLDDELRAGLVLDREHRDLDLEGALGVAILDELVEGMLESHDRAREPGGAQWPRLRPSTIQRKGHAIIGIATGRSGILDPRLYQSAPRDYRTREVWWSFPTRDRKLWKQAHGWQNGIDRNQCPPRKLIGWTREAMEAVRGLVKGAEFNLGE